MRQTKLGAAGIALVGDNKISRLLGHMELIGFLCKLKTSFAVHGNKRNVPVHGHTILGIQV